jgi:hypothetical protein
MMTLLRLELLDRAVLWIREHEELMDTIPSLSIHLAEESATISFGFFRPDSETLRSIVAMFSGQTASCHHTASTDDFRVVSINGLSFSWHVWTPTSFHNCTEEITL